MPGLQRCAKHRRFRVAALSLIKRTGLPFSFALRGDV
jgi:hypothetical protein